MNCQDVTCPENEQSTLDMVSEGLDAFNKATKGKRILDGGLPTRSGRNIQFFRYELIPEIEQVVPWAPQSYPGEWPTLGPGFFC
jgi:hypothetical protein